MTPLPPDPPFPLALSPVDEAWVQEILAGMSLEERIGQMIHLHIPWNSNDDPEALEEINALSRELHAGGHIVGGRSAEAMAPVLAELQRDREVPLLISADFESGVGRIWSDATRFPCAMAQAATWDPEAARITGAATAREARAAGVHWILAPVSDVNINPENPIINIRSYGEDVESVSEFAVAFAEGVQSACGLACAKHYPGHGDTATDSHMMLARVDADRERLEAVEFPPFQAAINAGVASVMTSHIWFPALMGDEGAIPATVSPNVMTGLLRREMNFGGVLCTDSMRMRGLTNHFEAGEAAVRSVIAGVDVILVSADYREAQQALLEAVRRGVISEERIARSVERILRAKAWLGLHREDATQYHLEDLLQPETVAIADRLTERSITAVRSEDGILPLVPGEIESLYHIALFDESNRWWPSVIDPMDEGLARRLGSVTREIVFREPEREVVERFFDTVAEMSTDEITLSFGLTERRHEILLEQAQRSDMIVVTAYVRIAAHKGAISLSEAQVALLNDLIHTGRPVILICCGSPYMLEAAPEAPVQILTYDYSAPMARALAGALLGDFPITGRLPVTLPGVAARGHGLQIPSRE
ncbi:glycoside hydrolase family 3 C-terminal domain-containing protein [Candidatus Sumerlaeota bacterium]|nr:glycoside hydrolase family 3 C-terminal domain-containing protein [Candidatus Sumerlaeota bacterium]